MNGAPRAHGFAHGLAAFGSRPALRTEAGTITYADLAGRVDAVLARLGSTRSLVLVEMALSVESVAAYLAALKGSHPVILASPETPQANAEIVEIFQVGAVADLHGAVKLTGTGSPPELHPDLALLLSTSGSTGSAKLVRLSHRNIQSNAEAIAAYLRLTADDVGAATLPLHYSFGLSILNSHLSVGASVYLYDRPLTEPTFLDDIRAAGCTNLSGVPYSYEVFERIGFRERPLGDLRFLTVAGGRLPPEKVRLYAAHCSRAGAEFFVMYGQTEAAPRIAYLPPEAAEKNPDCIGVAIPGGELSLRDEAGAPITATHVAGELVYRGPNVMMGYAQSAADLKKGCEVEALRTGDLGERTEAGFIRIVGRMSRFSKLAGLRISHDEVERRLSLAGVVCAVTGDDERLAVAVTADRDAEQILQQVMALTGLNAGRIAVLPSAEIPRLPTGKTDYRAIRERAAAEASDAAASVHAAFAEAFWPRQVAADDSFVSLAGDSLAFVNLTIDLERLFGVLPDGWEETPIADLEARLRSHTASRAVEAKPDGLSRPKGRPWSRVDVNTYVRVIAIASVVLHHLVALPIKGGAYVLTAMLGYTLARFQSASLFSGNPKGVLGQLARNLLVYGAVLVFWMIGLQQFRLPELLLVSNIVGDGIEPIAYNVYWFVEAYAIITLIVCGLFQLRPLRRAVAHRPFVSGVIAILLGGGALKFGRQFWDEPWNACHYGACSPFTEIIFFYAAGWSLYFARASVQRLLVLLLCAAIYVWGGRMIDLNFAFTMSLLALLAWRVGVSAPRPASEALSYAAANSYIIYLVHLIPYYFITESLGATFRESLRKLLELPVIPLVPLVVALGLASLTIGVGASLLVAALIHRLEAWFRRTWSGAAA